MASIGDLERNDIPGALAYVTEVLDREEDLDPDDGQTLLMLQDDSTALETALRDLYEKRSARGLNVPSFWEA